MTVVYQIKKHQKEIMNLYRYKECLILVLKQPITLRELRHYIWDLNSLRMACKKDNVVSYLFKGALR